MIIQRQAGQLLLITQPDHAALSATLMALWRGNGFAASPRRETILSATRRHDDGWLDVDRAPLVAGDGTMLDFVRAPEAVKLAIWPRAVDRLSDNPYVAALVAQHALRIYDAYRAAGHASAFFAEMQALRDRHLAAAAPLTVADLTADYFFLRMGDTLSLVFCNGWTESRREAGYRIQLSGSQITVDPDPFDGFETAFTIEARQMTDRRFTGAEAAEAFERATVVTLRGSMRGAPPHATAP